MGNVFCPLIVGNATSSIDPLITEFEKVDPYNLTDKELSITNDFVKSLRQHTSLFDKLVWIHPLLGMSTKSRGANLLNPATYKISFEEDFIFTNAYTIFCNSPAPVDISAGLPDNTDMMIGMYVSNNVEIPCYDIGQHISPVNRQAFVVNWPGTGMVYDVGNYNEGRVLAKPYSYTKFLVGNAFNSTLSLWRDGEKLASKSSNVPFKIPELVYNANPAKYNGRKYGISILSKGLTDQEIVTLTGIVNTYMYELGRSF